MSLDIAGAVRAAGTAAAGVLKSLQFLEVHEGLAKLRPDGLVEAYWDSAGSIWTIGYGTTGRGIMRGTLWTLEQCGEALGAEVGRINSWLDRLVTRSMTAGQRAALISFAYNVGLDLNHNGVAEGLGDSTLLRKFNAGDVLGAADEFPKWSHAGGEVVAGLVNRRAAERALFMGS